MRKKWLVFFGLWAATTVYILLFPTRHFTSDAVNNLIFIEQQNHFELWFSQHLLAQWPGYWLYQLFDGQIRAWEAMRYAHALLAGATVALVYAAILELTGITIIAVMSGLVLAVSHGFWYFQSNPDVYSAGYVAVALLLLAYVRYLHQATTGRLWALGLAASFAMLMHQLNIEFAGLIGLSLIWLASRPNSADPVRVIWKQVGLYALICAVVVSGVYLIGYQNAGDALVQAGGSRPPLIGWILGYFNKAQAGDATWGVSLSLSTLPLAGYTLLLSWVLPPLLGSLTLWSAGLLGVLLLSSSVLVLHAALVLRRAPRIPRLLALVCALTLLLNGISGWWWQAGNVKFYLFMQLQLITLVALYVQQVWNGTLWQRRISRFALAGALLSLILFHLTLTLPYETQGGVFTVADQVKGGEKVWFDTPAQADIYKYITPQTGAIFPADFCQTPPPHSTDSQVLWVVNKQQAAQCPPLANAALVASFQADRSRQVWEIYRYR